MFPEDRSTNFYFNLALGLGYIVQCISRWMAAY